MNFFARLFGMNKVVEKGTEMLDEAIDTPQERSERDTTDLAKAREMALPSSHGSRFDILVDGFSRLVRPGVTLWLLGGFTGWWNLPKPGVVEPYWENVFMIVLTFWFGGRAILKDLPAAIRLMRGK